MAHEVVMPGLSPGMIQGVILFCLIGSDVLLRYRVRFVRRLRA